VETEMEGHNFCIMC